MNVEKWIIERRKRQPNILETLQVKRTHLWRVQAGACVPSYDLAARIAAAMTQDGVTATDKEGHPIPLTAGVVMDHCAGRIAQRVKDKGAQIWPDAPWALALREAP